MSTIKMKNSKDLPIDIRLIFYPRFENLKNWSIAKVLSAIH